MKYLIKSLLIGLTWGLCACSESCDEESSPSVRIPFRTISLSETVWQSDSPFPIFWMQEYSFSQGWITECHTQQSMSVADETFTTENRETVTYPKEGQAVVTDEAGGEMTYTLDEQGYALLCVSAHPGGEQRSYSFDYKEVNKRRRLVGITEKVGEALFSSLSISYDSEGKATLQQRIGESVQTFVLTWETGHPAEASVPPLFLSELYPLSTHTATLYGGLLGDDWKWLKQVSVEGSRSETLSYTYLTGSDGTLSDCTEVRSSLQGESSSRTIHYGFTY